MYVIEHLQWPAQIRAHSGVSHLENCFVVLYARGLCTAGTAPSGASKYPLQNGHIPQAKKPVGTGPHVFVPNLSVPEPFIICRPRLLGDMCHLHRNVQGYRRPSLSCQSPDALGCPFIPYGGSAYFGVHLQSFCAKHTCNNCVEATSLKNCLHSSLLRGSIACITPIDDQKPGGSL